MHRRAATAENAASPRVRHTMTEPTNTSTSPSTVPASIPTGIRVASTICWIVGILSIGIAFAIGIPAAQGPDGSFVPLVINLLAGLAVCAAGYLVRKQRKLGTLLVVLAWATPALIGLATGTGARGGSFLLFAAMLALFANWKHLR
jgi:hypothetical protein